MDKLLIIQAIDEFFNSTADSRKSEARLLETALYIEDIFNITLTDEEITAGNLDTAAAVRQLVEKKHRKK